jgi:hypothetical protein
VERYTEGVRYALALTAYAVGVGTLGALIVLGLTALLFA